MARDRPTATRRRLVLALTAACRRSRRRFRGARLASTTAQGAVLLRMRLRASSGNRPSLIVWHCSAKLQSGVQLLTACRDCLRRKYEVRIQRNAFVLIEAGFFWHRCSLKLCSAATCLTWAVSRRHGCVQAPTPESSGATPSPRGLKWTSASRVNNDPQPFWQLDGASGRPPTPPLCTQTKRRVATVQL